MADTTPSVQDKADDEELLNVDDDKQSEPTTTITKEQETKPEITTTTDTKTNVDDNKTDKADNTDKTDKTEEKEEVNKTDKTEEKEVNNTEDVDDEESELSSSDDDEEDLISNTEDWDITFKLAQFLDNHFILSLLNHLKNQKNQLQKNKDDIKEDAMEEEDNKDDNKDNIEQQKNTKNPILMPSSEISLISEKLMSLYDDEDINKIEFEVLSKTCLIDEQLALFDVLKDTKMDKFAERKQGLEEYKKKVISKLSALEEICGPLIDFLGEEKSVNDLIREKSFNLESISAKNTNLDLNNFNIDNLFAYCRLRYEIGFYQDTDILLSYYRMLTPDLAKKNAALWGQLSAQILQNKWDDAFKSIRDIREHIEDNSRTLNLNKGDETAAIGDEEEDEWTKRAREILEEQQEAEKKENEENKNNDNNDNDGDNNNNNNNNDDDDDGKDENKDDLRDKKDKKDAQSLQIASIMRDRAWLLHWSLFVFFNKDVLLDELIESFFLNNKYMNVIQTMCPHLLRYLTSAILISPNIDKQTKLKYLTDVSKVIIEEQYTYKDPITEFVRLVIRTNDFNGASIMLSYAMDVIKCDFFLSYYQQYFIQYARTTFLIKYCRLYNRISVENISKLLLMNNMSNDEIQLWLINAIRSENINAKLDVLENVIYVHFNETNPYQEMKDRTKSMNQRTLGLYNQIKNKLEALNQLTQTN